MTAACQHVLVGDVLQRGQVPHHADELCELAAVRVAAATLAEDRGSERRVQGLRGDSLLLVAMDAPERERLAERGLLGRGLALVLVQQPLLASAEPVPVVQEHREEVLDATLFVRLHQCGPAELHGPRGRG